MNNTIKDDIIEILYAVIRELNMESDPEQQLDESLDTVLLGRKGKLDSLELVRLIVAVEQKISDSFGIVISLADDKAFSQVSSPFRTVGTLLEFIVREMTDAGVG